MAGKGPYEKMAFELRPNFEESLAPRVSQEEHSRQRVKKDKGLSQGRTWPWVRELEGSSLWPPEQLWGRVGAPGPQ